MNSVTSLSCAGQPDRSKSPLASPRFPFSSIHSPSPPFHYIFHFPFLLLLYPLFLVLSFSSFLFPFFSFTLYSLPCSFLSFFLFFSLSFPSLTLHFLPCPFFSSYLLSFLGFSVPSLPIPPGTPIHDPVYQTPFTLFVHDLDFNLTPCT